MAETGVGRLVSYRNRLLMIAVGIEYEQLSLTLDTLPRTNQPVILVKFSRQARESMAPCVLLDVSDLS